MAQFFNYFQNKLRHPVWHTRVHAARIFADVARGNGVRNSQMFDAFGPQLNTFMSVGILLQYFRRKLLQFE